MFNWEVQLHEQSSGATSSWVHSIVWEATSKHAGRGTMIVRILDDQTEANTKSSRFTPYRYEEIDAHWFNAIKKAANDPNQSVGSVVNSMIHDDATNEGEKPDGY